jgi:hypothetical protein
MSDDDLLAIYRSAWDIYYSGEHVERVIRRSKAWGYDPRNMMIKLLSFHAVPRIEKVHPLEGGLFRRKYRRDRRPEMPLESPFVFYPRYAWEILSKHVRFARMYWQHWRTLRRVERDSRPYSDVAMSPVEDSEFEEMQIYTATPAAKFAVEKLRRRKGSPAAVTR